jgi:hypothetical protein
MALKKSLRHFELVFFVDRNRLICYTPFIEGVLVDFAVEIKEFVKRNSLGVFASRIGDKKEIHYCCPRCLKAFAMKKSEEMNLSPLVANSVKSVFDCEWGHDGYYIDGEELEEV